MECTQRLECTQDLYASQSSIIEKESPEQIGFLGICGKKYPVKKGPNKIGRDPQTCNIVLNLNSVSRQHAVINVLHKKQYMLMDLDSANKTKLLGKNLQPYVPQPLSNGDTVQFGEIFGIFRLFEDEDELPMTQAIDIPETPVHSKHASRFIAATTVPESPDMSDKDDSFIVSSQTNGQASKSLKSHNFIKPGKTICIQPIGSKKIDNIFWNSSKKSTSINLDDSVGDLNNSATAPASNGENDIHEMETEAQFPVSKAKKTTDAIFTAETQLPSVNYASPSIYSANTQLPNGSPSIYTANTQIPNVESPNIYTANTQLPDNIDTQPPIDNLPQVCKINNQQDMKFDLFTENKENDNSIYNAETQVVLEDKETSKISRESNKNLSDDDLIFDEVDNEYNDDNMESQAILTEEFLLPMNELVEEKTDIDADSQSQIIKPKSAKRNMRIESNSSDDIDIIPTQKIPELKTNDDDETDCEDDMIELNVDVTKTNNNKDELDFENMATQVISVEDSPIKTNIEDLPTQVLDADIGKASNRLDFEDLPTQVIDEDISNKLVHIQEASEVDSPFKVPVKSAVKAKKKNTPKTPKIKPIPSEEITAQNNVEDERYYQNTQDIFDDLCSQRVPSPEIPSKSNSSSNSKEKPDKNIPLTSPCGSDAEAEEKINNFVSNLSSQDVREVIGVNEQVAKPTRMASDSSDVDVTPKKNRPFMFMDSDLPNSQEIKTSVSNKARGSITESSSDSEPENNSEEQCTPILFHKKKKPKRETKIDLTKVFDAQSLPTRVITRVRKPTAKIQDTESKKLAENILKPKFLTEQEENIDKDIINENIMRLKSKNEKSKSTKDSKEVKSNSKNSSTANDSKVANPPPTKRGRPRKQNDDKTAEVQSTSKTTKNDDKKTKKETKRSSKETKQEENKPQTIADNKNSITLDSSTASKRSVRSTKSSKTKDKNEKADATEEKETEKRTRTRKKEVKEPSPAKEVRRSKRQRTVKEKKEVEVKSILKKTTHEQSTVYNLSSGSNTESPRNLKRSATHDELVPSPKRTRSANSSLRATPARTPKTHYVLFTAFPYEQVKFKLEKLGAIVVTDVTNCTVLLTLQIKRTFKLLCAVGLGIPIVDTNWVQACADTNMIVDPWLYIIKDETAEKRFKFNLERTLKGKRNFLKGYNLSSTPSVMPTASEMKLIVESSGGRWATGGPSWVCISCSADAALWGELRARGATLVTTEFILGGVLRQKADFDTNTIKL